ncbi:hypothetical protein EJ02DRAFT_445334 [Clathrospora elynae]|uniref:HMG box domain-containing protein n=1 Tax=Clathrospora elynae TaxID=706981 RepID=A0A6A5SKH5_9PLEO|nr:hypothetical protein EJ02DRAFT_445334 [Clathrospora elynae]
MRFISRLHACAAASVLMIVCFTWRSHSAYFENTARAAWRGNTRRVVVFGNDWSDTGSYRVAPPTRAAIVPRDPDRGQVWVETLCRELMCNTIDNFARSKQSNAEAATVGALVDSTIWAQVTAEKSNNGTLNSSSDFKTQVGNYLAYDKEREQIPQRLRRDDWTLFTLFFGLWDLLEYLTLEKEFAMRAIDKSIEELFRGLDTLAAHVTTPVKVVIPKMVDVTYLPLFQAKKNAMADFAENQHRLVFLWKYWNTVLLQSATVWTNGTIYMPDPHRLIMEQVRAKQLHSRHISDALGVGLQEPLFDYIEQPCLRLKHITSATDLHAAVVEKCSAPAQHLFWDDIQLSGPAHQLIGRDAVGLVRANQAVNIERLMQGTGTNEKPQGKEEEKVGDNTPTSPMDDAMPSGGLCKSTRAQEPCAAPTLSPVERTKQEEMPSPASTSLQNNRKRLSTVVEVVQRENSASPSDDMSLPSASSPDFCCLCQPEPKIPRPRNAFILYRQHHQQSIIARNAGLNNPEISKIIGEQWKAEGAEAKKNWQDLAQEEKARHQEQYPDYRYQPRRAGKAGSSPLNPTGQHTTVDKYRCHKCGGRSIKTPTSPFVDSAGTPNLPPPNFSEGLMPTTRYLPMTSVLNLESPVHRHTHGPSSLSNIQVSSALREDATMYSPLTPNKKRRFEYGPPQYAQRRDSLPPIMIRHSPPNSVTMQPLGTPRDGRKPSAMELSPATNSSSPRTVEEVLNAFPYPNKIKLLGRITPPYKASGPGSQNRGAIIAVEGDDIAAVKDLSNWLHEYLIKQKEFKPRMAEPPKAPKDDDKDATFEDYLNLIKVWHGKSKEMIKYITSSASPSSPSTSHTSDKDFPDKDSNENSNDSRSSATSAASPTPAVHIKPVIILPTFQLQASVAYASRIPIQDAYSATDHWQWMATLWRGTVGPDLTLCVKSYEKGEVGSVKPEMDDVVRCLTVFRERGAQGKFADADLRRVGFEVREWIEGMGKSA